MSEWGDWIEHDGNGCRCVGEWVHAVGHVDVWGNIIEEEGICEKGGEVNWSLVHPVYGPAVIRYRIRKPKGLTILTDILREVENTKQPEYTN